MRIFSLVRDGSGLRPVEIEFSLLPGLPQIHYLGLADQLIKESLFRIKSAFRSQHFQFPKTQQVIVNIRPTHIKKTSRGIDLAVATGVLYLTGQIDLPDRKQLVVYGELGLDGQVYEPEDLLVWDACLSRNRQHSWGNLLGDGASCAVLTGQASEGFAASGNGSSISRQYEQFRIKKLRDFFAIEQVPGAGPSIAKATYQRDPIGLHRQYSPQQAQAIRLAALGRHHLLLAGSTGTGKTTVAHSLISFYSHPESNEILGENFIADPIEIIGPKSLAASKSNWWPVISPHHSITQLALVGGGLPVRGGEIVRAHRGMLILDEFLEFNSSCLEALREPMETQSLRIARGNEVCEFTTDIQVVATTNLCRCGQFVPGQRISGCRCGRTVLERYLGRISGPILDRFPLGFLLTESSDLVTPGLAILDEVEKVRIWRKAETQFGCDFSIKGISLAHQPMYPSGNISLRRHQHILGVARTIADLNYSNIIKQVHLEEALEYAWFPFQRLKLWK